VDLERWHREAGDAASFVLVYVREAHALDEWVTPDNTKAGIGVVQPLTVEARCDAAKAMCTKLDVSMPAVTDTVDDAVSTVWGAWPDRIYVLDESGVVVHKTAVGPFGFKPKDVREVLVSRWGLRLSPGTYDPPTLGPPKGAPPPPDAPAAQL
jgi:iodothyronine deiodinase-like protein